jgi:hypothetical protein
MNDMIHTRSRARVDPFLLRQHGAENPVKQSYRRRRRFFFFCCFLGIGVLAELDVFGQT